MSRLTISNDLYSLLPGLTATLPPELIELTSSLLSQSRTKAERLGKDQEGARGYVCANLACERYTMLVNLSISSSS